MSKENNADQSKPLTAEEIRDNPAFKIIFNLILSKSIEEASIEITKLYVAKLMPDGTNSHFENQQRGVLDKEKLCYELCQSHSLVDSFGKPDKTTYEAMLELVDKVCQLSIEASLAACGLPEAKSTLGDSIDKLKLAEQYAREDFKPELNKEGEPKTMIAGQQNPHGWQKFFKPYKKGFLKALSLSTKEGALNKEVEDANDFIELQAKAIEELKDELENITKQKDDLYNELYELKNKQHED